MILKIWVDGREYSAQHWLDYGLPAELQIMLDGTRQELYIAELGPDEGRGELLRKVFKYPNMGRTLAALEPLYRRRHAATQGEFLRWLLNGLQAWLRPNTTEIPPPASEQRSRALGVRRATRELQNAMNDSDCIFFYLSMQVAAASSLPEDKRRELQLMLLETSANLRSANIPTTLGALLQVWVGPNGTGDPRYKHARPKRGDWVIRNTCEDLGRWFQRDLGSVRSGAIADIVGAAYEVTVDPAWVRKAVSRVT